MSKEKAAKRINTFLRIFQYAMKLSKVRIGINTKTSNLVIQDSETELVARVDILKLNKVITDINEDQVQMSKVREIIKCIYKIAIYLTEDEADGVLSILMAALERMESEADEDDIHNISE